MRLEGEESRQTLSAAYNYALSLVVLERFEEAKSVLRKITPVARRVLGEGHRLTLRMKLNYAQTLYEDGSASLDDLREAVTTLEDTERRARRVLGGAHPDVGLLELWRRGARATLAARKTPGGPP